ncbi:MAG: hypothetical protein Q9M92_05250 [Enterobacterales bacterium]|nr:hypothetical protein [Enterobacterales bacterium]
MSYFDNLDIIIIYIYLIFVFVIGIYFTNRASHSVEDFFYWWPNYALVVIRRFHGGN